MYTTVIGLMVLKVYMLTPYGIGCKRLNLGTEGGVPVVVGRMNR